jgi:hypothetical protein
MLQIKINFVALAAGISTLLLVVISLFVPWWQFTAGNPVNAQVDFSPVNFNLSISGASVAIPLFLALNIACLLTLLAGGIVLTIYSIKPPEPYSKQLLGFGYKKPLYILIAFIAAIVAIPVIAQALGGISLPLVGAATITGQDSNNSVNVSAALKWPFYLAIVATGLSIAARFYHRKITAPQAALTPP